MKSIQFNTEMVKAILEGRKTVTRRVIKTDLPEFLGFGYDWVNSDKAVFGFSKYGHMEAFKQPFEVGDILYVKESWSEAVGAFGKPFTIYRASHERQYDDSNHEFNKWESATRMPKEAARIFLLVTDVRVEKLFNMTEDDAIKEGYKDDDDYDNTPLMKFWRGWNKRVKREDIGITNFEVNPFVFVIDFKMIDRNH